MPTQKRRLTASERLSKIIETARAEGALVLDGHPDPELPDEVLDLTGLKHIKLSDCALTHLPEALAAQETLERVSIKRCQSLKSLPESLGRRSLLKSLQIESCPIEALPDSVWAHPTLGTLSLVATRIGEISPSIKSSGLNRLTINSASLSRLPDELGEMVALKSLTICDCHDLEVLPETITALSTLETLEIYNTALSTLPDDIGRLTALTRLVLGSWGSNRLTRLPDSICDLSQLRLLWLADNQLEVLPERIGELKNVGLMTLENNQLTELPESLFEMKPFMLKKEFSFHGNLMDEAQMKAYKARIRKIPRR
ncbi:MAG: leucine-rich repeat domain-containing protein [Bradymonadia bacterium]